MAGIEVQPGGRSEISIEGGGPMFPLLEQLVGQMLGEKQQSAPKAAGKEIEIEMGG